MDVELRRLELPGLELVLYGTSGSVCMLEEAMSGWRLTELSGFLRKIKRLVVKHLGVLAYGLLAGGCSYTLETDRRVAVTRTSF